jgi:hypothetical protein
MIEGGCHVGLCDAGGCNVFEKEQMGRAHLAPKPSQCIDAITGCLTSDFAVPAYYTHMRPVKVPPAQDDGHRG